MEAILGSHKLLPSLDWTSHFAHAAPAKALRAEDQRIHPVDELVLTPSCRNAVRNAGIETIDELASKSWNDSMLMGHFLPDGIEEVSLRLHVESGRTLRETNERRLTLNDILARRN